MINCIIGNIFDSDAEALVNPVNCVGVMGKGLALEFKKRFPENFDFYKEQCRIGNIGIGRVAVFQNTGNPKYIINFPTKAHWKENSRALYIWKGLSDLCRVIEALHISSIAIPMLGCGLGGLDWNDIYPIMEKSFSGFDDNVKIFIYKN